jgi:hypothetical protein
MAWSWVWGVKIEIKSEHKWSLLLFGDGFFLSLLSKCSMFDNRVHIVYTWKDMCSQGNVVFFNPLPWGKEGEWKHISLVSKPNAIM